MQYHLSRLEFLPAQPLICVNFIADTFAPADIYWLPHHTRLNAMVNKRKAEHLAGRIAACEALREYHMQKHIPAIGTHREPLWPEGFVGSITHCDQRALAAVIALTPNLRDGIGIDCENLINDAQAGEIMTGIMDRAEQFCLIRSMLPFSLGLTLIFSAKESLFKALFPLVGTWFDFNAARVTAISARMVTLKLNQQLPPFNCGETFNAHWQCESGQVITVVRLQSG